MKRPSVPHLTIGSVYVGLTRVRSGDDIRIWPMKITPENVAHLTKLRRSVGLKIWKTNYINGEWNECGLQHFTQKEYKDKLTALQSIDLETKNVAELRNIAKGLNIQHRNLPQAALIETLQSLRSGKVHTNSKRKRKNTSTRRTTTQRNRKQKSNLTKKRKQSKTKRRSSKKKKRKL